MSQKTKTQVRCLLDRGGGSGMSHSAQWLQPACYRGSTQV